MQTVLLGLLRIVGLLIFAMVGLVAILTGLGMMYLVRKVNQVHGILGLCKPEEVEQIFQPVRVRGLGIVQPLSIDQITAYAHYLETTAYQILNETMENKFVIIKLWPIISEIGHEQVRSFSLDLQAKVGEGFVLVWDCHSNDPKLTASTVGPRSTVIPIQAHTTH